MSQNSFLKSLAQLRQNQENINPKVALLNKRIYSVQHAKLYEISQVRLTVLHEFTNKTSSVALATHCGRLLVTDGTTIFELNEHQKLVPFHFPGLETPNEPIYGQVVPFEYQFVQFCDKLLIKARFIYVVERNTVRCISSGAGTLRVGFGFVELVEQNSEQKLVQIIDMTVDFIATLEILFETATQRRSRPHDSRTLQRAINQFQDYIKEASEM